MPSVDDAPLDWDPATRRFRGGSGPVPETQVGDDGVDTRRVVVGAPPDGGRLAPPARSGPVVVDPVPQPRPEVPVSPARTVPAPDIRPNRTAAAEPAATRSRRWWPPSRRTVVRTALLALLVVLVLGVFGLVWGYSQFNSIDTVALDEVLASGNGTNYLIVGSDSRDGVSADDENAGALLGDGAADGGAERSDTILVLRIADGGARMLSVPRDLLVTIAGTGQRTRINAAFNGGPSRLIATLTDELGLPIHHYLEVDFVAFRDLVDALGGIVIDFPNPAFDRSSGLDVQQSGPVRLDGDQALAYVRARHYVEVIDGLEVPDRTSDLGRVVRQQQFLAAVVAEVGAIRNPFRLASVSASLIDGMRIDDNLSFTGAIGLLWRFRSLDPEPTSLPTSGLTLSSGAQVLQLVQPGADEVLAGFGSGGARGS